MKLNIEKTKDFLDNVNKEDFNLESFLFTNSNIDIGSTAFKEKEKKFIAMASEYHSEEEGIELYKDIGLGYGETPYDAIINLINNLEKLGY